MTKHTSSFKLNGQLALDNSKVTDRKVVLYEGPVRPLCSLAPNNVNTMAAAALAAHNLGLDQVIGRLVSDPK
jgi:predicted dinucleotide-utilizing enzyme